MRRALRVLWVLLALIVLLGLGAFLAVHRSLPRYDGAASMPGLSAPVEIERDALGVATINAANMLDAYRALGYVHAQERFFEMDLMRRVAAGELSELVGAGALPVDREHRVHRMRARTAQVLARATAEQRARLAAYSAGINAGLGGLAARPFPYLLLRAEPRPWEEADCVLVLDAMFFDLIDASGSRELKLAQLKRALPASVYALLTAQGTAWDAPLQGPARSDPPVPTAQDADLRALDPKLFHSMAEVGTDLAPGSNNFAVDGTLTSTGAALVADDMHLTLRVPNIWFRARIRFRDAQGKDEIDLIGATLPGVPALVAGSNRHIAWGFTNSYGDWVDWVRVHWVDAEQLRYRTPDGEAPVQEHDEVIRVHGSPDEILKVRETIWGPILADEDSDTSLALAWTAHRPEAVNIRVIELEAATDAAAAVAIAQASGIPPQNFVVGDSAGRIAWTVIGQIPRRVGFDGQQPSDWTTPESGWVGWLPADQHPTLLDPPQHRLWTANTRTADGAWLDALGDGGYVLGARAKQIRDDLFARERFAPQDMLAIQLDDRSLFLERWWKLLRETLARSDDASLAELKRITEHWDERAAPDAHAYRLVRAFRLFTHAAVLDALTAPVRVQQAQFSPPIFWQAEGVVWKLTQERPQHLLSPLYPDWDALLLAAARRVVRDLGSQPGGLAARSWGERNTARIRHPLSRAVPGLGRLLDMPAHALFGDANMPRVQSPDFGASERFAVSPGHEDEGYFQMPGGQSGHPLSPYYGAGHGDWEQGKPTPFMPGKAEHKLTLHE